ncbi:MAG: transglutaminase-like domain-containing protein [Oscillospiraceae bacterium]|nr:transglutaminase-like domain-containing protein [Oscillospiraceae bacterium]
MQSKHRNKFGLFALCVAMAVAAAACPVRAQENGADGPQAQIHAEGNGFAVISNAVGGLVDIRGASSYTEKIKVLITGPDSVVYQYVLPCDDHAYPFPLTAGAGEYRVAIYQNIYDNYYLGMLETTITLRDYAEAALYTAPNIRVPFAKDDAVQQKAAQLCAGKAGNQEKASAVLQFMTERYTYDYKLAEVVAYDPDYRVNPQKLLEETSGVCLDFATLYCAMLRSQDVPCKLIFGYVDANYHAWVEYHDGGKWVQEDPTYRICMQNNYYARQYVANDSHYAAASYIF